MHLIELLSPEYTLRLRAWATPYGLENGSRFSLFATLATYRLHGETGDVRTPMLVTDPAGEQRWTGQSRILYDALAGPKDLVPLTADDRAGPMRESRIFDWLDAHLSDDPRGLLS